MLRSDCAAVESVSATAIVWSGRHWYCFDGGESHMDYQFVDWELIELGTRRGVQLREEGLGP